MVASDSTHRKDIQAEDATSSQDRGRQARNLDDHFSSLSTSTSARTTAEDTLTHSSPDSFDAAEPSPLEAEEYLTLFHTYKSMYFPFVFIPSTTTAQQLRQERPFLWLCIMMVASKSTSQQQVLGSRVRDFIAREMILKSGQNIDLLLGLLASIAWHVVSRIY